MSASNPENELKHLKLLGGKALGELAGPLSDGSARSDLGHGHTLAEVAQQPDTWRATAQQLPGQRAELRAFLQANGLLDADAPATVVLSGSGSSAYAGGVASASAQAGFAAQALPIADGDLVTHDVPLLPSFGNVLHVSLARSGNSPESVAAVDRVCASAPKAAHLAVTCNSDGKLASLYQNKRNFDRIVLDGRTNDRSLVMTSSFTNLALASGYLGTFLHNADQEADAAKTFAEQSEHLATVGEYILSNHGDAIANAARKVTKRAVFLGSGPNVWSARENSLKLTEMTAGGVLTFAESFLGLRHGPMCAVDDETLVVALLSNDPYVRAYEKDLLAELAAKQLGAATLVAGANLDGVVPDGAVALDTGPSGAVLNDGHQAIAHVLIGQLVGLFACLQQGLQPDTPSPTGVIERVVPPFVIHPKQA